MSERYKREIEEILKQAGEIGSPPKDRKPRKSGVWQLIWLYVKRSLGGKAWSFSPGRVMLIAISLLLAALMVRPFGGGLVAPLAWAGLLLFIIGYAMFFVKPPKIEKRWRGQVIEESRESLWNRIRRKFSKIGR